MAQDKSTPLFDLHFVPERTAGKKAPWYRCGAIWPTENEDVVAVDFETLNPATGQAVRFRLMATRYVPKQDNQD
jgi:hypothetical protein